jgi:large subunit ribosomal protein L25
MSLNIKADKREKKESKADQIPAVVYGFDMKSTPLSISAHGFRDLYKEAGESTLVDLEIVGAEPVKVLIHETQKDPVSDEFIHVDFYRVDMTKKVTTEVAIIYVGEAPGVKDHGADLNKNLDSVEIECLPQDLIHEIKVDLTNLKEINDIIKVEQLSVPENVTILTTPDTMVVALSEHIEAKEEEAVPAADVEGVEVEGKKETPTTEDGAAVPTADSQDQGVGKVDKKSNDKSGGKAGGEKEK